MGWELKLGASLLAIALIFGAGWQTKSWQVAAAKQREGAKAEVRYVERNHNVYVAGKESIKKVEVVRWRTKEILKEVHVYVPEAVNTAVPNGVVRLLDAAAANEDPPAPSPSDGAAGQVDLAGLTSNVVDNYGTCNVWREKVIGLQEYIKSVVPES